MTTKTESKSFIRTTGLLERLVVSWVFWAVVITLLFINPVYQSINRKLPNPLPVFSTLEKQVRGIDENGKNHALSNLKGRFIIFHMSKGLPSFAKGSEKGKFLQKVQKRVRGLGQKVALLSYTEGAPLPAHAIKAFKYARALRANPYVWSLIHIDGQSYQGLLKELSATHGSTQPTETPLYLVDHEFRTRGSYRWDKESQDQMMIDLGLMINRNLSDGKTE